MIKEPKPLYREEHVITPGAKTIVEVHRDVIPDQLIDSLARGIAKEQKYGFRSTVPVAREIRSKIVRVTYG